MLTPEQIKRRAENRYEDVLRSLVAGGPPLFPLTLLGGRFSKLTDFTDDRAAILALKTASKEGRGFGFTIAWAEKTFRKIGPQRVPSAIAFQTCDDFLRFLGKETEAKQFEADCKLIKEHYPNLQEWVALRPGKVIAFAGAWERLLNVCLYLKRNPKPACYLRELPVETDTKFVERHMSILSELLPLVAPETVCSEESNCFEERFGFKTKASLVRFRFLDPQLREAYHFPVQDLAVPLSDFSALSCSCSVLVVENEMTFLTLPNLLETVAVFGAGDAAALLRAVPWLKTCRLYYWGDMDVHGFETLSLLRETFPQTQSILMDEATFYAHAMFVVGAAPSLNQKALLLTQEENRSLKSVAIQRSLLEQERIGVAYARAVLERELGPVQ